MRPEVKEVGDGGLVQLLETLLQDKEGVGTAQHGQQHRQREDQVVVVQTASDLHPHDIAQTGKWEKISMLFEREIKNIRYDI